jgi:hypothetical protein
MPQPSSIAQLAPEIRAAVDAAIREGRATIADIVALIGGMGASASKSAVGRYKKTAEEQMKRYREAQEVAKVWVAKMGEEPEGNVGRLLPEMLRLVAFQTISTLQEPNEEGVLPVATPDDIMLLAKAFDHLSRAEKTGVDRVAKERQLLAERLADIEKQAKAKGEGDAAVGANAMTGEDVLRMIRESYGIPSA